MRRVAAQAILGDLPQQLNLHMAPGVGIVVRAERNIGRLPELGMQEQRRRTLARPVAAKFG